MTYSLDFRRKVFSIKTDQNLTFLEASILFNISMATLFRWSKKIEPNMTRHKPATRLDMDALKSDVQTYPDAYQFERAQRLGVSRSCIFYALKRLKVTYKKNTKSPKSVRRQKTILPKAY
ncbi:MAG: transposase [Gammaproteobacteria bacterium CG_4_10_14_0_8_um_filter_38_16]|nr:MAG: transposase [Gammaproteobacteria bacterium CG_4_10_14_0_8_um_filter_38_16]